MQYEYIGHENYKFLVTVPWKKKINKILAKLLLRMPGHNLKQFRRMLFSSNENKIIQMYDNDFINKPELFLLNS